MRRISSLPAEGGPDAVEVMKARRGPWVVTRTFSKAYALAGLRLGYAICSSHEMANALRLVTSTFNLVGVAEAAALAFSMTLTTQMM